LNIFSLQFVETLFPSCRFVSFKCILDLTQHEHIVKKSLSIWILFHLDLVSILKFPFVFLALRFLDDDFLDIMLIWSISDRPSNIIFKYLGDFFFFVELEWVFEVDVLEHVSVGVCLHLAVLVQVVNQLDD
jgi:hypothetical protein